MKGIILAGGHGSRLYPSTIAMSKQLIPVYDKPMIYYPLSILMLAGIKDILIISTPEHLPLYEKLFRDGSQIGLNINYAVQEHPKGLAEAFIIGENFIGQDNVCLMLGDNIFYGHNLTNTVKKAAEQKNGGTIFGYYVDDPKEFGVVEFDKNDNVISVEEKPQKPKSNYAIPGMYFFDNKCVEYAKNAETSHRGEIEITSVINEYIKRKSLKLDLLGRGTAWLDTGTNENLVEASFFMHTIEKRQGLKVACLEEIAYTKGFIDLDTLKENVKRIGEGEYATYLKKMVKRIEADTLPIHDNL
ncbi:MAG: glucose-1-phosphate thymidylyltransferase RfbA [Alphaproteobacteria bacterium]|nr:glucose-1-phosphate thymidylyltransferase RfbA [Alphaproteobacteria bacterium]